MPRGITPLLGKRGLGWLSWQLRRRHVHRPEVLEALLLDLEHARPDHVVVTGDLTNISLPEEFEIARGWLERLGAPAAMRPRISLEVNSEPSSVKSGSLVEFPQSLAAHGTGFLQLARGSCWPERGWRG